MQVQQVFEAYSTGTASQGTEVRPGDKARVSSGKIKLSLLSARRRRSQAGHRRGGRAGSVRHPQSDRTVPGRHGRCHERVAGPAGVGRQDMLDGKGLAPRPRGSRSTTSWSSRSRATQAKPYMDVRLFTFPGPTPAHDDRALRAAVDQDGAQGRLLGGHQDAGQSDAEPAALVSRPGCSRATSMPAPIRVVNAPSRCERSPSSRSPSRPWMSRCGRRTRSRGWWSPTASASFSTGSSAACSRPSGPTRRTCGGQVFSVQLAELTGEGTLHVVVNRYHEHPSILITSFILGSTGDGKPSVIVADASEILLAVDETGDGDQEDALDIALRPERPSSRRATSRRP